MDYDEARRAFFEEFEYPEAELAAHIRAIAETIRSHIERAYLERFHDAQISRQLERVMATVNRAREAAEALDDMDSIQKYEAWRKRVGELLSEAMRDFSDSHLSAEVLGGGKRKLRKFLNEKLPYDATLIAIEKTMDLWYSRQWVKSRRRLYHGAGLMYYLGLESWDLRKGEAFPAGIREDHDFCRRYHSRRGEAKKYLTWEARTARFAELRSKVIEREVKAVCYRVVLDKLRKEEMESRQKE